MRPFTLALSRRSCARGRASTVVPSLARSSARVGLVLSLLSLGASCSLVDSGTGDTPLGPAPVGSSTDNSMDTAAGSASPPAPSAVVDAATPDVTLLDASRPSALDAQVVVTEDRTNAPLPPSDSGIVASDVTQGDTGVQSLDAQVVTPDGGAGDAGAWWTGLAPTGTCGASASCQPECPPRTSGCVFDCASTASCTSTCAPGSLCHADCAGSTSCSLGCKPNAVCSLDCASSAASTACSVDCEANASCATDCRGAIRCATSCKSGASCETDCRGALSCGQHDCGPGAACLLRCDPGSVTCGFASCAGALLACPGGVIACNRACP